MSEPLPDGAEPTGATEAPQPDDQHAAIARSPRFGRAQIKLLIRLAIAPIVAFLAIGAVGFLSRTMADITRSEETAAIFNVSAKLHHDLVGAVDWRPDPDGLPKALPPLEREALTETWLRAWAQFLILSDGFDPVGSAVDGEATDGIAEYFDGAAAEEMLEQHTDWLGLPIHQIGHDLQLNFYSDDGAVVSISSVGSRFLRGQPVGDSIEWYDTVETYDAVFVLQDGNWRIYNWVRRASEGAWATDVDVDIRPLARDDVRALTWEPSGQTIERFWTEPDLARAASEIAVMDDLGFNTLRFELPFELLGGRDVELSDLFPAAALMDIAEENGLSVIVSLLSDRTEHQPLHWDADDDHLRTVMETLGDHPALILWEIGSEPDTHLGIERVDERMLDAWLTHVGRTVREADSDTPISIGWSSPQAAIEAPPIADVVAFSWYGDRLGLEADLELLRDVAGERPIMISDAVFHTGADSIVLPLPLPVPPLPAPGAQSEKEQARWFADMLIAVDELDLAGFNVGTLRDFDVAAVAEFEQADAERLHEEEKERLAEQERLFPPPPTPEPKEAGPAHVEAPVIAEVTWPTGSAAMTGLVRVDGSPKPAVEVFAPGADLDSFPAPTLSETLQKPFNMLALGMLAAAVFGWLFLWLWARNIIRIPSFRPIRLARRIVFGFPIIGPRIERVVNRVATRVMHLPYVGRAIHIALRLYSLIPIPHIRRRPADGNGAQQRRRRTRKKVSVTAPIEQQPAMAVAAPEPAPKSGMFRRVIDWLNAPVLPEGAEEATDAGIVPAADGAAANGAPVVEDAPALAATNGVVANGVAANGVAANGVAANGVAVVATETRGTTPAESAPLAEAVSAAAALDSQIATQQAEFNAWLASQQGASTVAVVPDSVAAASPAQLAATEAAEQLAIAQAAQQAAADQLASEQRAAEQAAANKLAAEKLAAEQAAAEEAARQAAIEQAAAEEAARQAAIEQAAADKLAAEQAAVEAAARQLAIEQAAHQLAAEQAAAEEAARQAAIEQAAADKLAIEQAAAEQAAAEEAARQAAADKLAIEQAAAEQAAAEEAARQAAIEQAAADKLAAQQAAAKKLAAGGTPGKPTATPAPSQPMRTPDPLSAENHNAASPGPPTSLADALPSWPSHDMLYDDVHDAMFGTRFMTPPSATAMAVVEIDLQPIDRVLESMKDVPNDSDPTKYAPFLLRALCMVSRTFDDRGGEAINIDVTGPDGVTRRIDDAHDKRLGALMRELLDQAVEAASGSAATVLVQLSSSSGQHLSMEMGDGSTPTVSLVHLHKRPIATRDELGCTAISTHSMGLLSVAASSTPTRADEYLDGVREILETRDWAAELD
ncbi:MAG: hypothetical protein AAF567_13980 [Actinomycetota bacterium]